MFSRDRPDAGFDGIELKLSGSIGHDAETGFLSMPDDDDGFLHRLARLRFHNAAVDCARRRRSGHGGRDEQNQNDNIA